MFEETLRRRAKTLADKIIAEAVEGIKKDLEETALQAALEIQARLDRSVMSNETILQVVFVENEKREAEK